MNDRYGTYGLIIGKDLSVCINNPSSCRLDRALPLVQLFRLFYVIFRLKDHKVYQSSDKYHKSCHTDKHYRYRFVPVVSFMDIV